MENSNFLNVFLPLHRLNVFFYDIDSCSVLASVPILSQVIKIKMGVQVLNPQGCKPNY